ncbi:MAG: alkaline phosphatase D family protein [Parvularculaceae bacterium]
MTQFGDDELPVPPRIPSASLDKKAILSRVGFGSCYVPQFEKAHVWNAIRAARPDAFLFIGDNVYQSEENGRPQLLELRAAYAALAEDRPFAALREATPILPTWDDHDYGMNDAGAEFPARKESEALFKDVWAIPTSDARRIREGVYFHRTVGPAGKRVQLILLDTRYFRTKSDMLGAKQWSWLEKVLLEEAEIRILASSIPLLSKSEGGESWNLWPQERKRLFELINDTRVNGLVIVSGDSHFGAFYLAGDAGSYALNELTSSSLNFPMPENAQSPPGPPDAARDGAVFYPANFGIVRIEWSAQTVWLELNDSAGVSIRSKPLAFAELRP